MGGVGSGVVLGVGAGAVGGVVTSARATHGNTINAHRAIVENRERNERWNIELD